MAEPFIYTPTYSYSGYQASNPTRPLPAPKVDNDFAKISQSTSEIALALRDIRRSDGKLQNGLVTIQSLESSLSALIAAVPGLAAAAAVSAANAAASAGSAAVSAGVATGAAATATAAAQRALENATGLVIATQAQAKRGAANDKGMSPLRTFDALGFTSADFYKTDINTDTQALQTLAGALPNGACIYITRTYTLNAQVVFPQNNLTVVFVGDVYLKQADGTQSLDNLVTFSGANGRIENLGVDGNAYGTLANPTANGNPNYTGRGEVCIISGDGWFVNGARLKGSAPDRSGVPGIAGNLGSALVTLGNNITVRNLSSVNTGLQVIRNRGDNNTFVGLLMLDFQYKAFVDDGFVTARLGTTTVRDFKMVSASTQAAGAVLFDSDQRTAARVVVEQGYVDLPNIVANAAATKFVYVNDLVLRDIKIKHGAASLISIRIQQAIYNMLVDACELDARIAFDATVETDLVITGKSKLGLGGAPGSFLIQDFRGRLRIDDGCALANWTAFAVNISPVSEYPVWTASTVQTVGDKRSNSGNVYICTIAGITASSGGPTGTGGAIVDGTVTWAFFSRFDDIQISMGRLILTPPSGNTTAKLVNTNTFANMPAGAIQVEPPLLQTAGALASSGSTWVTNSASDELMVQIGANSVCREFAGLASQMPPILHDNWRLGDIMRVKNAAAGTVFAYQVTTGGTSNGTAWTPSTAYSTARTRVYNGAGVYELVTPGTSAASGGPSGTVVGAPITDGDAVWKYVAPRAVWKAMGSLAA